MFLSALAQIMYLILRKTVGTNSMIKIFVYERTNVCSGKDRRNGQHIDILHGRHNRMRCRTDKVGFEAYMIIDEGQGTIFLMHYIVYCCHRSNARVFS